MKVHVHPVDFTVDHKLVEFIQKKLDKLDNFYDRTGQTFAHGGLSHQSDQGALVLEGGFLRFGVCKRECGGEQEGCGIFLYVHGDFFGIEVVGAGGNLHEVFCGGNNTKPAGFQA